MRIAENAQFVAAREAELRHDGDNDWVFEIVESLHAVKWPEDVHAADSARFRGAAWPADPVRWTVRCGSGDDRRRARFALCSSLVVLSDFLAGCRL